MDQRYTESLPMWQAWWIQADLDTRIAMGDQNAWAQYQSWAPNVRLNKQLYFNKILRVLNMISGYQRKNRLTSIVVPIENENQQNADDLSGCLQWCMQTADGYNTISNAFTGSLKCGMNVLSIWMDFRNDPENGDIRMDRLGFNSFIMDPFFTNINDCGWFWNRKWINEEELRSLAPDIADNLDEFQDNPGYANRGQDMKFMFQPQATYLKQKNIYAYDEYWTREHRTAYKLLDITTGELAPWPYSPREFSVFREIYPLSKLIKVSVPTVKRHVLVNSHLIHEELTPWGLDRLPFIPVMCYHDPDIMYPEYRLQGIVRALRDSQLELNRRRNKMLDILDAQINSGWIVKEGTLIDDSHVFMSGVGKGLFVNKNANIDTDIKPIAPPQTDQGDMDMQTLLEKEIFENAGATEELFGQGDEQLSGIHTMLRQGAALVGFQPIFDNLNLAQKHAGNVFLDLIQANFSEKKVQRIIKRAPTKEFFDSERERLFDCVVEQGLQTETQKQMQFAQLLQLQELGIQVPPKTLIRESTLQNKQQLIDDLAEVEKSQAEQLKLQAQIEIAKLRSEINLLESNADNARAAAAERQARAVSNIGLTEERIAKADQDRAQANLDHAKALREIEELDTTNLKNLVEIANALQSARDQKQKQELQKTEKEARTVGSQAQRKPK